MLRELGKQTNQAECIIQISQSINKRWVSVSDNRGQRILRSVVNMLFSEFDLTATQVLLVLFKMSLNSSKLIKECVVFENFKVFNMEVSFIIALKLFLWFSGINSFKNAKSSDVLQR